MENKKELCCRCIALILWSLGAAFLMEMWRYQQSLSDPLGAYIQFTVMFLATFYVLALFPIKHFVNRFFFGPGVSTEASEHP